MRYCRAACPRPTEVPLGDRPPTSTEEFSYVVRRDVGIPPYNTARSFQQNPITKLVKKMRQIEE